MSASSEPPTHRLYGKLLLNAKGEKVYLSTDKYDDCVERSPEEAFAKAQESAPSKLMRLATAGLALSRNDCRVVVFSQFLCALGSADALSPAACTMLRGGGPLDGLSEEALRSVLKMDAGNTKPKLQMVLSFDA